MKHCKHITAMLLAAMLLMSGCGETATENTETTAETAAGEVETTPEETKLLPDLPEADYEGYSFRLLTKGLYNVHWRSIDAVAEELTGEPINDVVFNRNTYISETFNVKFEEMTHSDMNPTPLAQKLIQAGDEITACGCRMQLHGMGDG